MQYTIFEKYMNFCLQHRCIAVAIFSLAIISVLFSAGYSSYSLRLENENFKEIQGYLEVIRKKDEEIYNKLDVRVVDRDAMGIDVSSWQGEIDWDLVKSSGIDFAFIRVGFRGLGKSNIVLDKQFKRNISEANRVGIPVGVYFFSTAINENEVLEEATFVLNNIKDYDVIYPVVYDFETFNKNRAKDINPKIINDNAIKFLDYMRAHGYHGMLYSNLKDINKNWIRNKFIGYKLWFAQYADVPSISGYGMWQYTDSGKIPGIKGKVDLNKSKIVYEIEGYNGRS